MTCSTAEGLQEPSGEVVWSDQPLLIIHLSIIYLWLWFISSSLKVRGPVRLPSAGACSWSAAPPTCSAASCSSLSGSRLPVSQDPWGLNPDLLGLPESRRDLRLHCPTRLRRRGGDKWRKERRSYWADRINKDSFLLLWFPLRQINVSLLSDWKTFTVY